MALEIDEKTIASSYLENGDALGEMLSELSMCDVDDLTAMLSDASRRINIDGSTEPVRDMLSALLDDLSTQPGG